MATLSLATNYIALTEPGFFVPDSVENSGHLQLVYQQSDNAPLQEAEVQIGLPLAIAGDWQYPAFGQLHGGANTSYIGADDLIQDSSRYSRIELSLKPGQTAESVWELIGQIHASFARNGADIDYDVNQNSNSYITTVLGVIGIPLTPALLASVTPEDVVRFPGAFVDVLQEGADVSLIDFSKQPITLEVAGTSGDDYINSGIGNDILGGAAGNDTIFGGGGNDTITGGAGFDILDGGAGTDTYIDSNDGGLLDTLTNFEEIEGGSGDGSYDAAGLFDSIFGGFPSPFGFQTLSSETGFRAASMDVEPRGPAALVDAITNGVGELFVTDQGDLNVIVTATGDTALRIGDFNWGDGGIVLDTGRTSEAILGSDEDDVIRGTRAEDLIVGLDGDDRLFGRGGDDEISGEAGNDKLFGQGGKDALYGDRGDDQLFGGGGRDSLFGGSGEDDLFGGQGHDLLSAGTGDDYLSGGSGNDTLIGAAGADRLFGDSGTDTADYSGSSEGVSVQLSGSSTYFGFTFGPGSGTGGDAEGDILRSIENLIGSDMDDVLVGGNGRNELAGGAGNDILTGGRGRDTFIFTDGDGSDSITDFDAGHGYGFLFGFPRSGDQLYLDVDGFDTVASILAVATETEGDVIFDFGGGDMLTLEDVSLNQLNAHDFELC